MCVCNRSVSECVRGCVFVCWERRSGLADQWEASSEGPSCVNYSPLRREHFHGNHLFGAEIGRASCRERV